MFNVFFLTTFLVWYSLAYLEKQLNRSSVSSVCIEQLSSSLKISLGEGGAFVCVRALSSLTQRW